MSARSGTANRRAAEPCDMAPSRDGKKLFVIGSERRVELVKYDLKSRRFEPYLSGISAEGVSFSKDGQWEAYASTPEGTLWRSKLDGSDRMRITLRGCTLITPLVCGRNSDCVSSSN